MGRHRLWANNLLLLLPLALPAQAQVNEIQSIVSRFQTEWDNRRQYVDLNQPTLPNISIRLGDTEDSETLGKCLYWEGGTKEILISEKEWQLLSHPMKEQLIFHELAHCALGWDHDDHVDSMMSSSGVFSDAEYTKNRERFLNKLFARPPETK